MAQEPITILLHIHTTENLIVNGQRGIRPQEIILMTLLLKELNALQVVLSAMINMTLLEMLCCLLPIILTVITVTANTILQL